MTTFTLDQLSEVARCINDPVHFINNHTNYLDLVEDLTSFKLRENQEKVIRDYHENQFVITPAPRQSGKTLIGSLYSLYYALFNQNVNVGLFGLRVDISKIILNRVYNAIPSMMMSQIVTYNKDMIKFENGSSIFVNYFNVNEMIGMSWNLLYLDEFGLISNEPAQEFMNCCMSTLHKNEKSKLIISSTDTNFVLGRMTWDAIVKKNGFVVSPMM